MASKKFKDWGKVDRLMPLLIKEFAEIVNKNNLDSALCIPDFIIAEYLVGHLSNLAKLNAKTEGWSNE